jgi:plastocyanin
MKKIYSTLLLTILTVCLKATSFTVTIVGTTYSPATLTVSVGDIVTIQASTAHPLAEVSQATWAANGTTTLSTGFGVKTSDYTFTVTSNNTIYFVCQVHASIGMKGQIVVSSAGINEQNNVIGNISLLPNPAKERVSIKFKSMENGLLTAKMYSVCGQEIQSLILNKEFYSGDNSFTIELQNSIPSGVYFVQLNYNSKKIIRKIIIE